MGCMIISGKDDDGNGVECAVFYCSTTGVPFGRIINDLEEAQSFQDWVAKKNKGGKEDLRQLTHREFSDLLYEFREEREKEQ